MLGSVLIVTGGTGYLGSVVVAVLADEGHDVRALVRDEEKARRLLPAGVEIVVGDISDADAAARAAHGCSGVLHLAGTVGGTAEEIHAANVEGARAVLAAAVAAGVRAVRAHEHRRRDDGRDRPGGRAAASAPPALTDPYSASKAAAEELVLAAAADGRSRRSSSARPASTGRARAGRSPTTALFRAAAARRGAGRRRRRRWAGCSPRTPPAGHLLALDHGEPGRRYVLCGEVARVRAGAARLRRPPSAAGGCDRCRPARRSARTPSTFARRSEVYGMFPPVHFDDAGARALGLRARAAIDEGIALHRRLVPAGS